jgi:hypothetical protein
MTCVFTLNIFQHNVTAVAATNFLRGQDFHASRIRSLNISAEAKKRGN